MADSFCLTCGTGIPEWDGAYYARNMLCIPCYQQKQLELDKQSCGKCGVRVRREEIRNFRGNLLCPYCLREAEAEAKRRECAMCRKWIEDWQEKFFLPDNRPVCKDCHGKARGKFGNTCHKCGKAPKYPFIAWDGKTYCQDCAQELREHDAGRPMFSMAVRAIRKMFSEGAAAGAAPLAQ